MDFIFTSDSLGIYQENYSEKKIKIKQKNDNVSFIPTELPNQNKVKSVGEIVGKL